MEIREEKEKRHMQARDSLWYAVPNRSSLYPCLGFFLFFSFCFLLLFFLFFKCTQGGTTGAETRWRTKRPVHATRGVAGSPLGLEPRAPLERRAVACGATVRDVAAQSSDLNGARLAVFAAQPRQDVSDWKTTPRSCERKKKRDGGGGKGD
jgi:hypothetical protein